MKRPRRWAVSLAALLMATSLVFAPREGSARPAREQYLPVDPRPMQEMGGPDVPPNVGPLMSFRVWLSSALLARGFQVDLAMAARSQQRSTDTRLARLALRVAVNP